MRLLYSNMLPLKLGDGQTAFIDYFMDAVREADEIDIAVGYVSKAALKELQGLVDGAGIKRVCLTYPASPAVRHNSFYTGIPLPTAPSVTSTQCWYHWI